MAHMIPGTPKDFHPSSLEGTMFSALETLPDDFYVLHSFKVISITDGAVRESETDFVVFHPERGILCLEAKAGHVRYGDGRWVYGSGVEMKHGGPFEQARISMRNIMDLFDAKRLSKERRKCKFLHAVWFPSIKSSELSGVNLPSDADRSLLMLHEDLYDPRSSIERIFRYNVSGKRETTLNAGEVKCILNRVLCPNFDLFVSSTLDIDLGKNMIRRMIDEQVKLLDFLEDQPIAAINGAAGTGKTVVALEKAQRNALLGEKTLFLCYNRYLRDYLATAYSNQFIDFFTLDALATKLGCADLSDLSAMHSRLIELYVEGDFPYKHAVVDEGQDFGQSRVEESGILDMLSEVVLNQEGGSFYIFYDKMQCVQSVKLPSCIEDADCRITLRRNCRNTENIATTSMRPIGAEDRLIFRDGVLPGVLACLYLSEFRNEAKNNIERAVEDCVSAGYTDIVVLSCKSLARSVLLDEVEDGVFKYGKMRIPVTTCRKYKGLEADAVVLIDVDKESLLSDEGKIFYVGASRARLKLDIVATMSDAECVSVAELYGKTGKRKPKRTFATALNAELK